MKKWLTLVLAVLLIGLQYRLWVGEGSFAQVSALNKQIRVQGQTNQQLLERNRILYAEVVELKSGYDEVESRARSELGMIKKGETFYLLVDE